MQGRKIGAYWGILAVLAMASTALAEADPGEKQPAVEKQGSGEQAKTDLILKGVSCAGGKEGGTRCGLGDELTVSVDPDSLERWSKVDGNDPRKLVLFFNGRMLEGVYGRPPDAGRAAFQFDLKRLPDDEVNRSTWNALLSNSKHQTVKVSVGIGREDRPTRYGSAEFTLEVLPWYWPGVAGLLAVLVGSFWYLAYKSDLLRDPGPEPSANDRRFYSLARCQMGWWFLIVVASYLYIWMLTGDRNTLSSGVLILIGISAATGFGAVVVDASKWRGIEAERETLRGEKTALAVRIAQLEPMIAASPPLADLTALQKELAEKKGRLTVVEAQLAKRPEAERPKSQRWFIDILSEDNGVSFHRFQMVAWTLVLGLIFLYTVYHDLVMPDFDTTLLGLMGISSSTYVGFKLPDASK
jgi:hypothetical protein